MIEQITEAVSKISDKFTVSEVNGNIRIAIKREIWDARKSTDFSEVICEHVDLYRKLKALNFEGFVPSIATSYRRADATVILFPSVWLNKSASARTGGNVSMDQVKAAAAEAAVGAVRGLFADLVKELRGEKTEEVVTPEAKEAPPPEPQEEVKSIF